MDLPLHNNNILVLGISKCKTVKGTSTYLFIPEPNRAVTSQMFLFSNRLVKIGYDPR